MNFEENWPRGFRGEVVQRCGRTTNDGRTDNGQTNDDGQQVITIARLELCSGELKKDGNSAKGVHSSYGMVSFLAASKVLFSTETFSYFSYFIGKHVVGTC